MTPALDTGPEHTAWRQHATRLADTLAEREDLRDPRWRTAVAAVPRHLLVPWAYQQDPTTAEWTGFATATMWERIYSPETLVTKLQTVNGSQQPVSSSTKPDLMLRMLENLDVRDGHRVLEIGTGSGYNAALIAERLGNDHVFTVDIDNQLVGLARERLALAGYHPTIVATDGKGGLPEYAPYDRIIATCAVPAVPWAWADQLTDHGLILVDLKLATSAGNLVLLHRVDDRLEGRFTARFAAFMAIRSHQPATPVQQAALAGGERYRCTAAPTDPWMDNPVVWFLAQLQLPSGMKLGYDLDPTTRQPVATRLSAPDSSWVRAGHDDQQLAEAGPTPLWSAIEWAFGMWNDTGRPTWDRLGLTVTADGTHDVWIDDSANTHRWRLPERF
jgi:protein-L-isoaspartate(D-aspartate) O-methyltransferase